MHKNLTSTATVNVYPLITPTLTLLGGTALSFDGTNDFVQLSNTTTGNFGTGNFTVEMWINTTDSYGGLAGKLSGCGTNWDLFWEVENLIFNFQVGQSLEISL